MLLRTACSKRFVDFKSVSLTDWLIPFKGGTFAFPFSDNFPLSVSFSGLGLGERVTMTFGCGRTIAVRGFRILTPEGGGSREFSVVDGIGGFLRLRVDTGEAVLVC